ncbi:fumarylacetoacetate hydrolase family protein [Pseudonocardia alaniniphila]|uniref:Fumarylacetoacetate hydrolase family protein n=1 Tax=Pseudonocardia alaniniphila TaxID=75291 RepID=A0ABS9TCS2_9PSEU|nr:fumarylacetoacetate hydrolase family protein [Pseudonocardia alaniniphila]MCH6166332.1 fumarylacetoacetate hydrolase family protein [Pseudonocardia alaniniphila]
MRIVRYDIEGREGRGVIEPSPTGDLVRALGSDEKGDNTAGAVIARLDEVTLLAPCDPRTIVCVGSNYASQVEEKGRPWPDRPALFLKSPNSVIGPEAAIQAPPEVERLEYEGELAVVIGKLARAVRPENAMDHVLGFTCANDVTAHDWRADGQWARAKSADTFCPLGPWIETEPPDSGSLTITTRLGDRAVQQSGAEQMIFGVNTILAYVTRWITLRPGDVVLTGSPAGVGPMVPGDRVTVEIDGIGSLPNPVALRRAHDRTPGAGRR